jgi:3-isopropylmalate/(R)-2-methylmalate dehydratase large subunit
MPPDIAPRSLATRLWDAHVIAALGGGTDLVLIDRVMLHERTGGVALQGLDAAGRRVMDPAHVFATMDHIVDTLPGRTDRTLMPTGTAFLTLFDIGDPRQGIVHVISPEQGIVLPGLTLVCPDSHTCTQGAFGALAWGIGSTQAEHALATMTLRVATPLQMRIRIEGALSPGVTAKDLALHIANHLGSSGAKGHIVEYAGAAVRALDMDGRMTLCNMATELAAFTAVIAPDDTTFAYLEGRPYAPKGVDWNRAVAAWRTLASDPAAPFDAEHVFDAAGIAPMVTWGTSPQQGGAIGSHVSPHGDMKLASSPAMDARALAYMGLQPGDMVQGLRIDAAFIGSCTNARLSDLRRAAALLKGRRVAPGVRAICVPGSSQVRAAAMAEGLDTVFREAGFEWREAGCSMCFFAGGESFAPGARVISSTNRNFESRQGAGVRTHLASPETVAASAIAGRIADPRAVSGTP